MVVMVRVVMVRVTRVVEKTETLNASDVSGGGGEWNHVTALGRCWMSMSYRLQRDLTPTRSVLKNQVHTAGGFTPAPVQGDVCRTPLLMV